jgi:hypothetical protein
MEAIEQIALDSFVSRLATDLKAHFPARVSGLTPEELEKTARDLIASAETYEFTTQEAVWQYSSLVMKYADGLTWHPEMSWLEKQLRDPAISSPSERIKRVYVELESRSEREEANRRKREEWENA